MASAEASLHKASMHLRTAYMGLSDLENDRKRFYSGLMNAIVFARSVTLALQNMQNDVEGFKEWYAEKQAAIKLDPSARYFLEMRNSFLKSAEDPVVMSSFTASLNTSDLPRDNKPPGATSFIIGYKPYGGASGWLIENEDQEDELYVVDLPEEMNVTYAHFADVPEGMDPNDIKGNVRAHLEKLSALVKEARQRFGPK